MARETNENRQLILPIWHGVDRESVLRYSPPLADLFALSSSDGLDFIVDQLRKRIRPEESPLIVARDFLIDKGFSPPVVTADWWLDLIEVKESNLVSPDLNFGQRWIFPLPFKEEDDSQKRGLNIAWTALQMQWSSDGDEQGLCQLTPPEQVHRFLRKWPGLIECARANPGVLAMYAPQLTIPGFDDGLSDVFEDLMDPSREDAYQMPGYGGPPETVDGKKPLCGELIAWRHPSFGNYTEAELAYSFVTAHDFHYSRQLYGGFDCLIWLLSSAANWMPRKLRDALLGGMRRRTHWWLMNFGEQNKLSHFLITNSRRSFKFTGEARSAISEMITDTFDKLSINDDPNVVAERFVHGGFIEGYYKELESMRARRKTSGR